MAANLKSKVLHTNCSLIWEPYKSLQSRLEAALQRDSPTTDSVPDIVNRHREFFKAILAAPPAGAEERQLLNTAPTTGLPRAGGTATGADNIKLDADFVSDAARLSDALNLHEIRAAELLTRAELQICSFPSMSRVSIAVLLFYDGQQALVTSLHRAVLASGGKTWRSCLEPAIASRLHDVVESLMDTDNLFTDLLNRLVAFNPVDVIDNLRKHGLLQVSPRHQRTITESIFSVEYIIAEIIFYWCAQQPRSREQIEALLGLTLLKCDTAEHGQLNKTGSLLLTAMVNAVGQLGRVDDASSEQQSTSAARGTAAGRTQANLQTARALLESLQAVPAIKVQGARRILQFAIRVALAVADQALTRDGHPPEIQALLDANEDHLEQVIEDGAFAHLVELVGPASCAVHKDVFLMFAWHSLITNFIVYLPLRVRRIRMAADEGGRKSMAFRSEHGVNPPEVSRSFENLLEFLALLYRDASGRVPDFARQMIEEFWTQDVTGHSVRVTPRLVALYNFVVLHKEHPTIVPVNMYVPYCRMLATLCQSPRAAAVCFNFLRNQLGPSTVSLDHVFNILHVLHQKLRSDDSPMGQGVQIDAMELSGLLAALELVTAVVNHGENARVSLTDHPTYNPIVLCVSMLGCSLPIELKAACIDLLSAFASTPEGALKVWQYVEAAKLVPVTSYVNIHPQPGMQTDLEEVESRTGLYPVTIAFLRLLDTLTDHPLPIIVGGPVFRNGFDPYMNYLRDIVFLKFLSRTCRKPEQRWVIGALCLKIMEKILRKFSCVSDNVLFNDSATLLVKPASENGAHLAFNLLAHLLQNGQLLRLILRIIDEGITSVGTDSNHPGTEEIETCILLSLHILQQALIQQDNFLCEVRNSNAALIVTSLDQLLKGINPRTNRPDYCTTIGSIVGYFEELPHQALAAARVLLLLTRKCHLAEHLAVAFDSVNREHSQAIVSGFAAALDLPAYDETPPGKESEWDEGQMRTAIAQTILRMIQQCIELHHVPNVAHLLLGFNMKRSLNKATLERPGYQGTPKSCLHNTISLLSIACRFPEHFSPTLVELCFKLVYLLCANPLTSEPVTRYLRTSCNFFHEHLLEFPKFQEPQQGFQASKILMQQCWLLKGLAIELRLCAESNQRSVLKKMIDLLVIQTGEVRPAATAPVMRKLLNILNQIVSVMVPTGTLPNLFHFDRTEVDALLKACHYSESADGPIQVDISALHDRLALEKLTMAVSMSSNLNVMNQEIADLVRYAVFDSSKRRYQYARKVCLNAWREVIEVLVCTCQPDIFGGDTKMNFLLDMSTRLLDLICEGHRVSDSLAALTEVVLISMMSLAKLLLQVGHGHGGAQENNNNNNNGAGATIAVNAYSEQLLKVVAGTIEALKGVHTNMQMARSNLYGALLNILRIVGTSRDHVRNASSGRSSSSRMAGDRIQSSSNERDKLQRSVTDLVNSYGLVIMEVVCRDVCSGHHVIRMLALSVVNALLSIDHTDGWLEHIARKGYLTHITESLLEDDGEMQLILSKGSQDDKPIYLFGAKMNVLRRMAQCERGARMLLDLGLVNKLTELNSFQLRPVAHAGQGPSGTWIAPSVHDCYQRIYVPVMQLLCALSAAVKCNNQDCLSQLQNFLIVHSDVILVILQQRHAEDVSEQALLEVTYACKVVACAGSYQIADVHQGSMHKMRELMLAVLPWAVHLRAKPELETTRLELIETILHSCVSLLLPTIYDRKSCYLLFSPNLMAANDVPQRFGGLGSRESLSPLRLGLLVHSLPEFAVFLQTVTETKKNKSQRLNKVNELVTLELQELLPEEWKSANLDVPLQRGIVRDCLYKEVRTLCKQQSLLSSIMEQTLFILWRHLEFFLTQYVPTQETTLEQLTRGGSSSRAIGTNTGITNVTGEDVESLRASVGNVFTETYFRKLLNVEGIVDADGKDKQKILEALLNRIKTLVRSK